MITQIKKGDSFRCKESLSDNGTKVYTGGEIYTCHVDGHLTNDLGDKLPWSLPALNRAFEPIGTISIHAESSDTPMITLPDYYNNDNGSLYKIAKQRGWSPYAFDVVKRLDRGGKKDPLRQEIEKSIGVLQLWLKELE